MKFVRLIFTTLLISSLNLVAQDDESVRLRSGDNIEIRLGGVPFEEITQVTGPYTVDTAGFVNMPHIGRIKAAGMTQDELQLAIEKSYRDNEIYTRPTITVSVAMQTRFVNVGGEVRMPQRVPYTSDLSVLSAISAAGGFTEFANQGNVRLLRGDEVTMIDIRKVRKNPSLDVTLRPGDSVEVVRSLF
ncbi:MAG: polysaccharide biosynthesis/export family protein [Chthoniobacterales bacterium]